MTQKRINVEEVRVGLISRVEESLFGAFSSNLLQLGALCYAVDGMSSGIKLIWNYLSMDIVAFRDQAGLEDSKWKEYATKSKRSTLENLHLNHKLADFSMQVPSKVWHYTIYTSQ